MSHAEYIDTLFGITSESTYWLNSATFGVKPLSGYTRHMPFQPLGKVRVAVQSMAATRQRASDVCRLKYRLHQLHTVCEDHDSTNNMAFATNRLSDSAWRSVNFVWLNSGDKCITQLIGVSAT
jgi:hypothetical protein